MDFYTFLPHPLEYPSVVQLQFYNILVRQGKFHPRYTLQYLLIHHLANENGEIKPIRFQINSLQAGPTVVKVEKILDVYEEKLIGTKVRMYHCQSVIKRQLCDFELKYELPTCKWYLHKM